jgi:SAM-dependent methyltransferase
MSRFAESKTARATLEARFEAQRLAFAPFAFQAARLLRDKGLLQVVRQAGSKGIHFDEIVDKVDVSRYGVRVLLEAGLGIGLVRCDDDRFRLTKTGFFILRDPMTRVNMDFVNDCCYEALQYLERSIDEGRPVGLKVFGNWKTIYEGLTLLPDRARRSWFAFDHFYSDSAFPAALPIVFADDPKRILDIGGNTGRWAIQCAKYSERVEITVLDLSNLTALANANIAEAGVADRVSTQALDLLDHSQPFPKGFDVLWMSQLLVCFSESDATSLVRRAAEAMEEKSKLYILDTCWDQQEFEASSYSLVAISLYFTSLANGNSRMYKATDIEKFVTEAGLEVVRRVDGVGISHSLFECRRPVT